MPGHAAVIAFNTIASFALAFAPALFLPCYSIHLPVSIATPTVIPPAIPIDTVHLSGYMALLLNTHNPDELVTELRPRAKTLAVHHHVVMDRPQLEVEQPHRSRLYQTSPHH